MSAIGASDGVQTILGATPSEMLQETEVATRSAVADELHAMLKGVAAANLVRRHRIGLIALQTYSISRQLVRKKENAHLLPYVAIMKRCNKYGRKRASTTEPQLAPQPQLQTPTT
jgi:hypothetical protein